MTKLSSSGVIDHVEVDITCEGDDEHLTELILMDLQGRAEEINQIVELGTHPEAANSGVLIDWEGWLAGDYEGIKND